MNSLLKFSKHYAIPVAFVLAASLSVEAQSPVESTHIDEKYAYTTIVYKTASATDKDVLTAVENDFGIGDVVRVSLAPPPKAPSAIAASEPVYADKSKGEDAWMPQDAKPTANLTATSNRNSVPQLSVKTISTSPAAAAVAKTVATPRPITAVKSAVTSTPAPVPSEKASASPVSTVSKTTPSVKTKVSGKSTEAHKSVKKSGKKSGQKMKYKNRRHGKQHYSCPKF